MPPTGWRDATGFETVRAPGVGEFLPGEFGELNVGDVRTRGVEVGVGVPLPLGLRGEAFAQLHSAEDADGARIPYLADEHLLARLAYENRFFPSKNLRVRAAGTGGGLARRAPPGSGRPTPGVYAARRSPTGSSSAHAWYQRANCWTVAYRSRSVFCQPRRMWHSRLMGVLELARYSRGRCRTSCSILPGLISRRVGLDAPVPRRAGHETPHAHFAGTQSGRRPRVFCFVPGWSF